MFTKSVKSKVILGAAVVLAFGVFVPTVGASGASDDQVSGPVDGFNVEESMGWDTNLELVESLTGLDECLYRHSVFPAGGVGYADSSLPYEGLDEIDRAVLTVRAEVLRAYPDSVMDVVLASESEVKIVALGEPESGVRFSLDELLSVNANVASAVATLEKNGLAVVVDWADAPSFVEACEIEDQFRALKNADGEQVTVFTQPWPLEHVVEAIVNVDDAQFAEGILEAYGAHARVTTMEGRYEDAIRTSD